MESSLESWLLDPNGTAKSRFRLSKLLHQFPSIALDDRGRPFLTRSGLLLSIVIRHLSDRTWAEVLRLFPDLSLQDVRDTLAFSATWLDEGMK